MSGVYKTEEWLKKYGWSKGKGLGKNENGIKDFIKVDKKDDTVGLGGEGYAIRDFNWWDNIYNKAAQKLKIESTEDGKSVVHVEQPKVEVTPEKKYGVFVKSKEPDNFSSNIREEELIKVCEGRQLKASMTGKLARLEEQEKQVISSNTLRISKQRQEDSSDDSNSNKKQPKENKKPYGSNYRPLVLNEKVVQTGDKVKKTENNKVADNSNENNKESKKSKKNKKRKRSEMESKDDLSSNSKNEVQSTKTSNNKQHDDKKKTTETKAAPSNGFFFFNYDNENKKLEDASKNTKPQSTSIVELYSDGTERKSKSAKRKAKKQRTK